MRKKKKVVYAKQEQDFKISMVFQLCLANYLLHTAQAGPAHAAQGNTPVSLEATKEGRASAEPVPLLLAKQHIQLLTIFGSIR